MLAAGSAGSRALWYLTRGTGVVSLLLLTGVMVLGLTGAMQWSSPRWPRFVTQGLHRNLSLLAVAFIVVHVSSTVIDGFAPIRWLDAVVPFTSAYRSLWLGLGALAFDLFLALILTSLLRARLGFRAWRTVHWLAYGCWPVAVLHGLGTGSDTRRPWTLAVVAICVGSVLTAAAWRAGRDPAQRGTARGLAIAAGGLTSVALVGWLAVGPLAAGWAGRAGTPSQLLAQGTSVETRSAGGDGSTVATVAAPLVLPATSTFDGTVTQQQAAGGEVDLEFVGTLSGDAGLLVDIRLHGQLAQTGGLYVQGGRISLGPRGDQNRFQGTLGGVDNGQISAQLADAAGDAVTFDAVLQVIDGSGTTRGQVKLALTR
ncbi:MAG: ferric reductase-like transmembrane domain-containing protein [Actinomycetota bacterium]